MALITEDHIEQLFIEELQELGYSYIHGSVISPDGENPERDYNEVVLKEKLKNAIHRLNKNIPSDAKEDALKKVLRTNSPDLNQNNHTFHKMLTEGVDVEYRSNNRIVGDKVWLIDFVNPEKNDFLVVNQFTVIENNNNKRPDLILFVNGLPLVVIEIKNASDEKATIKSAFNQLQTYKQAIPSLFTYNAILLISDGWEARAGSLTAPFSRFMQWKSIDGKVMAEESIPQMEVMIKGMLNTSALLELIRHFTVFETAKDSVIKKIAAYHQFYAVKKAITTTIKATSEDGDKRAGVVWHTQGSGKSLSMVFYAGKIVLELNNPTIVVLTDRNDLDDQLFETFSYCSDLLRQTPVQAENRDQLKDLLSVSSGGIVFTTIQKFLPLEQGDSYPMLSDRRNIVVIADEAHRSQYDFIDGFARHMRDALPNASFIGFTGTPVESTDKNTQAVFGDYIDVYDIQQAVDDGATVRIYYESRLAKIHLEEDKKEQVDAEFDMVAEEAEIYGDKQQLLKAKWARLEAIVGNEQRIKLVAQDVVDHFEQRDAASFSKGMIVCMSRRIAIDLYNEIVAIRPHWHNEDDEKGMIKVIMTGSSSDPLDWQKHIRNKPRRKAIGERLKDDKDNLKLVIVRDMWLTGFDAPCMNTLYIDKPMRGHNLMQAIARVNRVYKDKEGGLVVDYLGIANDLKKALSVYTESGGKGKPTFDQEEAVMVMLEKYEIVSQMFENFDYKAFFSLGNKEKLQFPIQAADYILGLENGKDRFINNITALAKSFSISVPHPKALEIRDDFALFQAIKARIVKVTQSEKTRSDEEIETAIKQIISEAVVSDGVVDIFKEAGISKPDISILSDEFLAEIKGMKHKNLALELLKKLLNDEIIGRRKTNLIQARKFSEMLDSSVKRYQNNVITAAQIIEELIDLSKKVKEADKRGIDLGLDYRELAFYDALEVNDSAVKVLGDEILRHIAQELVDVIRKNTSIDWTIRESVQAKLRITVKKLLKKHGYPPDKQAKAVQTVLEQAKLLADELVD
ncbi:MAG: type I restriction endonuclease subunit R [Bacteroidales bacterium]|nr:type I restriction endonuclease subunit R [Bacteroidales bacterium]